MNSAITQKADLQAGTTHPLIAVLTLICIIFFVVLLMLFRPEGMTIDEMMVAAATVFLCLLPWPLWFAGIERTAVPLFPAFCTYLAFYFAAAPFTAPLGWPAGAVSLYEIIEIPGLNLSAYLLFSASVLALTVGYYAAIAGPASHIRSYRGPEPAFDGYLRTILWLMAVAHLAYSYIPEIRALPSIGQLLDPSGLFALGGLYLSWRRKKLTLIEKLAFILILIPLETYAIIRVLLITKLLLLIVFLFLLFLYEKQLRLMIVAGLFAAILLVGYRYTTAHRGFGDVGLERLTMVYESIVAEIRDVERMNPRTGLTRMDIPPGAASLVRRISQYWVFQHVHDSSPDPIPYLRGQTLRPLLTTVIPRVLYPDKPREIAGNIFGYRFGLLTGDDKNTSINIPWPTEMLANFGPDGLVIAMAVIGLCFAFIMRFFLAAGCGPVTLLTGLTVFHPLAYPESNISVMTGSMPLLLLCLILICHVPGFLKGRLAT